MNHHCISHCYADKNTFIITQRCFISNIWMTKRDVVKGLIFWKPNAALALNLSILNMNLQWNNFDIVIFDSFLRRCICICKSVGGMYESVQHTF